MAHTSHKKVLIDKASTNMLIMIAIATVALVFSAVVIRALFDVSGHRGAVIKEKRIAEKTLKQNDVEIGKLIDAFKVFENLPESVIGTADKNSKVVLDALPAVYDFPALATSLEKILTTGGYAIESISGIDGESSARNTSSPNPEPVEIPFSLSVSGPYDIVKNLPLDLERSIRPINILSMSMSGTASNTRLTIIAKTYYQPGRNIDIRYKEVR